MISVKFVPAAGSVKADQRADNGDPSDDVHQHQRSFGRAARRGETPS